MCGNWMDSVRDMRVAKYGYTHTNRPAESRRHKISLSKTYKKAQSLKSENILLLSRRNENKASIFFFRGLKSSKIEKKSISPSVKVGRVFLFSLCISARLLFSNLSVRRLFWEKVARFCEAANNAITYQALR